MREREPMLCYAMTNNESNTTCMQENNNSIPKLCYT